MPIGALGMLGLSTAAGIGATAAGNELSAGTANRWNKKNFEHYQRVSDFNKQQSLDVWRKTGPVGMMQELKKAGLNEALMYGMSGAGGGTTSMESGGPQGVMPEMDVSKGMGMTAQTMMAAQMQKAQIDNLNADTNLKNTDAVYKGGAQTANTQANTQSLLQGIENQRAVKELTEVQTDIARIDEYIKGQNQNRVIALSEFEMKNAKQVLDGLVRDNEINEQTKQTKIDIVKQDLVNKVMEGSLKNVQIANTQANTAATNQSTEESKARVKMIGTQIAEAYGKDGYEDRKIKIGEDMIKLGYTKLAVDATMKAIENIMQAASPAPVKNFTTNNNTTIMP